MPDTSAPAPTAYAFADALLPDLLAVSLTGVNLLRPLYDPDNSAELVDFAVEYLNPAAQRMSGLPEQPGGTLRTRFADTFRNGVFAFYQRVYQTGEAGRYDLNYQADGFDSYFHVAARRSGDVLVVSFTDTADQSRTPVEQALRDTQAAEQAARAAAETRKKELEEVFAQAPVGLVLFQGPEYRIDLANARMGQIWGRPLAQVLGHPVLEAMPEFKEQGFTELLADVYHRGTPYSFWELPITVARTHTGQPAQGFFNLIYQPHRDADGAIVGIVCLVVEVTEQVLARQQVQQLNQELEARVQARTQELAQAQAETDAQRQRLHQLIAEAPALIATLRGPAHVVELANEGFRAIFGGRELVGKPYREAIPEFEGQPFFDRLDRVYRTGETYHGIDEPVILDRTNSGQLERTYITYTYQATRDARGQIDGILVFCYEVTQQVLARQEREAQRQQLHDLFMQAPAAICILNGPELVYELVNPGYQALFPGRHLLGKPLLEALPEIAGHTVHRTFRQVYETGTTWQELGILIPLVRPDGVLEDRYFNYIQQARFDAQGVADGVLVFAFEVTEQVRARQQAQGLAQELTTTNQQLTRTNVDLDNFIYTASHDLKAPISNLEGLLYLLREDLPADVALADNVAATLDFMVDAVERFKRTIEHLTEVSKLQKEHTPTQAAVDLATVVENVRLDLLPQLTATNAQLTVDVTDFPPILFSEKNLRSVVYNLLSNALKYRHPDRRPHVDVQAHVRGGFTVLEVHDNGLGISEVHLPRLFTMFQRFHDHVEGTGIGLYMVKRMVDNAGGRMEVHSQLGTGTTFFVHLPHAPVPTP